MKTQLNHFLPPIFIFVLIGWFVVSIDWYVCAIYNKCRSNPVSIAKVEPKKEIVVPPTVAKSFNRFFSQYNQAKLYLTSSVEKAYPVINFMKNEDSKELHITGFYFNNETKELGLQRARQAQETLKDKDWFQRIKLFSKKINQTFSPTRYNEFAQVISINTHDVNDKFKVLNENIYFATNASNPQASANIQNYLKSLAERFRAGNIKRIEITGHTDNQGNRNFNIQLGQNRANTIGEMLTNYGVNSEIITTSSAGPDQPVEDNSTKKGRSLNRRVHLKIK